ncbi:hypothetical protein [Undibacterium sp.]|uniref:hypothetical protein n=1 Tax=Undibacterium sp. TaxID=1914977 RepID=UPI002C9E762F|nr:hypothetical protein [Undibacterium sp.]HTD05594.1 hypothetical protein [Undibacterium sp.]
MGAGREWPGGHLPFFASPKKGKPKKGDRRLALRVMTQASSHFVRYKKWETDETRCAQTTSVSDPFSVTHKMQHPKRLNVKNKNSGNQILQCEIELVLQNLVGLVWVLGLLLTFIRLEPR